MAIMRPSVLSAKVTHKRLIPKVNSFCYGVYYVALPLEAIENGSIDSDIALERFSLHSFYQRDHGPRDGTSLRGWLEQLLLSYKLAKPENVTLICMPRVLGYVFNPVSFWLCYNKDSQMYAVICEVNNTFGETHSYICTNSGNEIIQNKDRMEADKSFHVSPFLKREGYYQFQFQISQQRCDIRIDYSDQNQNKILITKLSGEFHSLSQKKLLQSFLSTPLLTIKAIGLIHYQAIRLVLKGIRYLPKPRQMSRKTTLSK